MISFSCSCGKKYQLPDRIGGREVRCNQCQKTLLVPKQSQDEPVVPRESSSENDDVSTASVVLSREQANPVGERSSIIAKSAAPEKSAVSPKTAEEPRKAEEPAVSPPEKSKSGSGGMILPLLIGIVALIGGVVLGMKLGGGSDSKPIAAQADSGSAADSLKQHAETLQQVAGNTLTKTKESLQNEAAEAATAVKEPDAAKRLDAMKQAFEARNKLRTGYVSMLRENRLAEMLKSLSEDVRKIDPQSDPKSVLQLNPGVIDVSALPEVKSAKWQVTELAPIEFSVKTADNAPILISLDKNPTDTATAGKGDKKATLNELSQVLDDKAGPKDTQEHSISLRIDSGSSLPLVVAWPSFGKAEINGGSVKMVKFSIHLSDKGNTQFKPKKPDGFDKTIEFSQFSLRLRSGSGYVEYVPADKDKLVQFCERARSGWNPIQIPIAGNDVWKRTDHGLVGPLLIDGIELHAKPTGDGITFWIDNLDVVQ